jgi:TolB protein
MNTHSFRSGSLRLVTVIVFVLLAISLSPIRALQIGTPSGSLAITGADGNIYLLGSPTASGGAQPIALTDDATPGQHLYAWPTWSTDGRLAFFGQEVAQREGQQSILLQVFITPQDSQTPALAYESFTETLTYAYWSPGNCAASPDCRDLALLTTTPDGLAVLRIRDEAPDFSAETIGRGGPFYYSFSPDGQHMIWQRFGRQLDLYDTTTDAVTETLPDTAGLFQAPMWSPVDDRLLFSVYEEDGQHDLVVAEGEERTVIAADLPGALTFAWSPDGQYVAYKLDYGEVVIVDSRTGDVMVRSNAAQVLAFLWSPDGTKLAYLALPSQDQSPQVSAPNGGHLAAPARSGPLALAWHLIDLAQETQWTYFQGFYPTRDMIYYLQFFDQFAQSHRLWSPDSRYLAYAEITEDGHRVISLLDTTDPAAPTRAIAEGQIAIWSFE